MNPKKTDLDNDLKCWKVDAELSPAFQENVWRAIARQQTAPGPLAGFFARLDRLFLRPLPAALYVATFLFLGVFGAHWQVQTQAELRNDSMFRAYVRAVDPYQQLSSSQ